MEFRDVLFGRRSVRAFTPQPVDVNSLAWLIEAASQAPSALNAQPWAFTVVRDPEMLDRISAAAKTYMLTHGAPGVSASAFRDQLRDPAFHIFYHAPALVLIAAVDAGPWAVEDCALAAQNLMLAAHAVALGTCWIGFAERWLQTDDGKALLGLPRNHVPVAPIVVGHPAAPPPPVPRHKPNVRWIG
jgi:nitroreductase